MLHILSIFFIKFLKIQIIANTKKRELDNVEYENSFD